MARSDWKRTGAGWMRRDELAFVSQANSDREWYVARFGDVPGKPVKTWWTTVSKTAMDYADKHYPMEREG